MLDCAHDWKELDKLPCRIKMLDVDDGAEADFYDHETYARLVEASIDLDPRIHAAVLLGGDGGLRRGEILALNLDDIDFQNGRFHVRRNVFWRRGIAIVDAPKGKKAKPIPGTPSLGGRLEAVSASSRRTAPVRRRQPPRDGVERSCTKTTWLLYAMADGYGRFCARLPTVEARGAPMGSREETRPRRTLDETVIGSRAIVAESPTRVRRGDEVRRRRDLAPVSGFEDQAR